MSNAAREFFVQVDGEQIQAWVAQERRMYRAWGTYRGRHIVSKERSEEGAKSAWRAAAEYAANE